MYDTLYAVPEGTATDFPLLRSREDWRVCQVLRHLCGGNPLSGETRPPGMSRGRVVNSHATPP